MKREKGEGRRGKGEGRREKEKGEGEEEEKNLLSEEVANVSVDTSVDVDSDTRSKDIRDQIVRLNPPILGQLYKQ